MRNRCFALSCLALIPSLSVADPVAVRPEPEAPPAPPPILVRSRTPAPTAAVAEAAAANGTLYSIGSPTAEEQYYLELINRARANPAAEGVRLATTTDASVLSAYSYFGVDLALMQAEFAALPVRPPLAFNAKLIAAARGHADDLFAHAIQGHVGTDGRDLGQRVTAAGYAWNSLGENVFSYAAGVWPGHAGFQVDWGGGGTGGMQAGRGHRANIHGNFREIGVGVHNGTNTVGGNTVGPQVVTQDFGSSADVFITGVAYYDLNGDNFYSPGEGIGGITVDVAGASYSSLTASSGGFAVPIPSATATRTVTFSGLGVNTTQDVNVVSGANAAANLQLTYLPPVISGPATPFIGRATRYTFNTIAGATSYVFQQSRKVATTTDSAEVLTSVTTSTTGTYSALSTAVKNAGNAAYRLAHPTSALQTIAYPGLFYVGPAATVRFFSRLGWATTTQIARVEASLDGNTWTPVYSQAGTGTAGETTFTQRTVSLSGYAGKFLRLRFAYAANGTYYNQTDNGVGWYIDDISFTDVFTPTGTSSQTVTTAEFSFTASAANTYLLSVRPVISGHNWAFGPVFEATGTPPPPFMVWAAQQETAASLPAGTIENNPAADYNGDGIANLAAYALGLSAVTPATLPGATLSGDQLRLRYQRDIAQTDITVIPEASSDLQTWYALGSAGAPVGFTENVISAIGSVQTRELAIPVTSGSRVFLRLRITRP